jgi:phage portal protein BeeE
MQNGWFVENVGRRRVKKSLTEWIGYARPAQYPLRLGYPATWLVMGGRGAGKTRLGAEWVNGLVRGFKPFAGWWHGSIALVGETFADVREVMIDGPSGIRTISRSWRPRFEATRRRLVWDNGAVAQIFSSEDPESLRGPQFEAAWLDEFAKWKNIEACFDMLQFGLRLGRRPRQLITTTPKPLPLLKRLLADPAVAVTSCVAFGDISPSRGEIAAELHLLRPDRVTVLTDARGWPIALEYREGGVRRKISLGSLSGPPSTSSPSAGSGGEGSGLQLSLFHPIDDHYGFPPLEAALIALDTHNAAGRWNKALLENSARPSGALVYAPKEGGSLSDEQFDRLKTEMEEGYSGAMPAGRPLLLEGGLDWKAMSLTPKDMDFIEAKNSASRDIALAFGVPPMLLGIPGDNTYANYQEANRAFYRLTILPLVARTAKELSAWLGPVFGEELRLWFDADQIEGLAGERDALWARVGAASFLSDDEKREAVGYGSRQ